VLPIGDLLQTAVPRQLTSLFIGYLGWEL